MPAAQVDLSTSVTISGAPGTTRDEVVFGDVTGYNVLTLKGAFTVANLTFADVRVSNNEPGYGGAIRFNSSTEASVVSNCVFRNCKTAWQAGAINVQSPVTIVDCVFEDNGTSYEGGAIQVLKSNASLTVDRCRFTGNRTQNDNYGHVIHAKGGADLCQSCTVRNSYFYGNGYTSGSVYKSNFALYVDSGVAGAIENCTFKQNGLFASSGSVVKMAGGTVRNCLFVANTRGGTAISDPGGAGSVSGGATIKNPFVEPDIAQAKFESDGVTPQKGWTEVVNKGEVQDWMTGAKDLLGRARVSGDTVDIGAVERPFKIGLMLMFR